MSTGTPSGNPSSIGRRGQARLRLHLPAELIVLDGTFQCTVRDLSQGGARLALSRPPRLGAEGFLRCLGLETFGTIVWQRSELCGMEFDEVLNEDMVLAARRLTERYPDVERARQQEAIADWVSGRSRIMRA
jgi:hypothetical protein